MILKQFYLIFGLIALSRAKECLEASKQHLSRCDMYFKCLQLPSKNLVWIPTQCDRGLIYEHSLQLCVLPGDDWECKLDENGGGKKIDDSNVYGINNLEYLKNEIENYRPKYNVANSNEWHSEKSESNVSGNNNNKQDRDDDGHDVDDDVNGEEEDIVVVSGENNDIEIIEDFQVVGSSEENKSDTEKVSIMNDENMDESSGDYGLPIAGTPEVKTNYIAIPVDSDPNSSVASHLQRLSQLIQSLNNTQFHKGSSNQELGPNDLNNFLAHHNIKVEYQHQPIDNNNKYTMASDGKIPDKQLSEILHLQQKLQTFVDGENETPQHNSNQSPTTPGVPTKIQIKSPFPTKNIRNSDHAGYASSQIVVNRPEGSVLFSLPGTAQKENLVRTNSEVNMASPGGAPSYITQDTLNAVLELSKQLISTNHQNGPNSNNIPEQNYLQPIFRPIYYNIPIHDLPIPIISKYEDDRQPDRQANNIQADIRQPDRQPATMEKISSVNGYVDFNSTNNGHIKTDSFSQQPDEHSTIIHNHIPITIESPSPSNKQFNKYNSPTSIQKDQSPSSSTENIYNSYGQQLKQSFVQDSRYVYQPYPPFSETRENPPTVTYLQEPHVPYTSFENVQFNSFQNQNPQNQIYPSTPHLNNDNVNNLINLNTPIYPTLRPHSATPANNAAFYQNQASSSYTNEDISETINEYLNNQNNNKNDEQQLYLDGNTANGYVSIDGDDNNDDEYNSNNNDIDSELNVDGDDGNDDSNVSSLLSNTNQKQKLELENKQLSDRSTSAAASDDIEGKKQLVHYGDSFMTLEAYKANVEPLLFNKATHNIEYVTCITGARQPSSTDCTKYFVCNAKTNKVLTYSCPDFTGFNSQSRFCDAGTFAKCRPAKISPSLKVTIDDNRRIQEQSKKALIEAQRVREEAIKAQQLTALIKLETQNILNAAPGQQYGQSTFTRRRPQNNKRKQTHTNIITTSTTTTTTRRPPYLQKPATNNKRAKRPPQRRLIKCSEPTKVADSLSIYNYFTCYKDNGGTLKAMKMTCPNGLMFCAKTKLCTSSDRC